MLSAQSYIDKIHISRDYVFNHRLLRYRTDFSTYQDLKKNSESMIINLCKLVFVLSDIRFQGRSDNEIIRYVMTNYHFGCYISEYLDCFHNWVFFSQRNDERNKEKYLRAVVGYSEVIENEIIDAFKLPLKYNLRTNFDRKRG